MPQTLSVAMIAMNEEANLPRTLESVRWADEIVVVDSGSKDRTLEIAHPSVQRPVITRLAGMGNRRMLRWICVPRNGFCFWMRMRF